MADAPEATRVEVRAPSPVDPPPVAASIAHPVDAPRASSADRPDSAPEAVRAPAPAAVAVVVAPEEGSTMPAPMQAPSDPGAGRAIVMARPDEQRPTCTTAQLRRFIKSRPWVPMHELRRRFAIWGPDDDVTPVRVGEHTIFVGLPAPEGEMLGELLQGGDVGYELSLDPEAPIVVGVYPMRPVPRS